MRSEDALGQAYSYDAAGQVKFAKVNIANPAIATVAASPTHSYGYDSAGNRNSSLAFGQTTSYVADSVNQYISISGGGFQLQCPRQKDENLFEVGVYLAEIDVSHKLEGFCVCGNSISPKSKVGGTNGKFGSIAG